MKVIAFYKLEDRPNQGNLPPNGRLLEMHVHKTDSLDAEVALIKETILYLATRHQEKIIEYGFQYRRDDELVVRMFARSPNGDFEPIPDILLHLQAEAAQA